MVKHKQHHKRPSKYHLAQLRHFRHIRKLYEHHAAAGLALLLPFAVIILVSILYRLSIPEADSLANFYEAWIFSPLVVVLWAVVFPLIALIINLGSLVSIVKDHRYNGKIRPYVLLRDALPSLVVVLLVLAIFTIVVGGGLGNFTVPL